VDLELRPSLVRPRILWISRAGQSRSGLALELHSDRGDGGIGWECEDDSSIDEVEISEMPRAGLVELNPDRHWDASDDSATKIESSWRNLGV
jgi:hypothetical protein